MNPVHSEWTEEYSVGNLPALKETVWAILQHLEWTVDYSVGNQRALRETVWASECVCSVCCFVFVSHPLLGWSFPFVTHCDRTVRIGGCTRRLLGPP